ncbi:MAG TPA: adenine deaminase [Bacteroidales bacterium]|jgi:adenine deaminase|nr:adenine deaminase [Bacteroidales bacterium]HQM67876.1 adenine deaminase [Bacteroidales bacterium]
MKMEGKIVDIHDRKIFGGGICISEGRIKDIYKKELVPDRFIMPGLIDAHIHIESSMITPGSFAAAAVSRGTVGTVSDPHEIANVLGIEGVNYMINDGRKTPFRFYFGAPSCVPATEFESGGAKLGPEEIELLLNRDEIKYLAEMMNFPGVINGNKDVLRKIDIARKLNKPVDGHAPGLRGEELRKYIKAGISTDHECNSLEEALEKISLGMKVIIREGSAGRNLNALKDLYRLAPGMIMLSSDDIHPEMLQKRHLDKLVAILINEGYDLFDVIRSVTINPVTHYKLDAGLLRQGDNADFIITDSPDKMNVTETWINGEKVYDNGKVLFEYKSGIPVNNFHCSDINKNELTVKNRGREIRIITAFDGDLFTKEIIRETGNDSICETDTSEDILKIIVKDRYRDAGPAVAFVKGFGLKNGAFASSVAHDSHNIIAIGVRDEDIVQVVNEIVRLKGGLAVADGQKVCSLQLNVAGIMSDMPCSEVAQQYEYLSDMVKRLGCSMSAPFMTMSFMALLVIPEIKLSDKGLFDVRSFSHMALFTE